MSYSIVNKKIIFVRNGEIPLIKEDNLNQNKYDKNMNCGWYVFSANRSFFFSNGWN